MKRIPLLNGGFTKVDDGDYENLCQYPWVLSKKGYVIVSPRYRDPKKRTIWMHRMVMSPPADVRVDHRNVDRTDNQKLNLRLATNSQNLANRGKQRNNKSGVKGVCWAKKNKKWLAQIIHQGKHYYLGIYSEKKKAADAYLTAANSLFGEFARQ